MTLVKTRRLLRSCAGLSELRLSESDRGAGLAAESPNVRGRGARSLPANAQAPRRRTIAKKRRKNRGMFALYARRNFWFRERAPENRLVVCRRPLDLQHCSKINHHLQGHQAEYPWLSASLSRRAALPGKGRVGAFERVAAHLTLTPKPAREERAAKSRRARTAAEAWVARSARSGPRAIVDGDR